MTKWEIDKIYSIKEMAKCKMQRRKTMGKYTIDLGNGVILTDLILNGTDFMTKEEVTADTFENMENVTITSEDGTSEIYENPQLVHYDLFTDGYTYFRIRNLSNTEFKANNLDAQVTYTALMTDTLMEE